MKSKWTKTLLILGACAWGVWSMAAGWFRPAVEPGKVTLLTADNFYEVRRDAGTLVALYMRPG